MGSTEKTVAVMLGDGFETVEAMAPVDILRRGGVKVSMISVMDAKSVKSAQDITVQADNALSEVDMDGFDLIFIPGGSLGVANLKGCDQLNKILPKYMEEKQVAAICAGPTVLADLGLLDGRKATVYPGLEETFPDGVYSKKIGIVRDGNLITGSGPGQCLELGFGMLEMLTDEETTKSVSDGMLC